MMREMFQNYWPMILGVFICLLIIGAIAVFGASCRSGHYETRTNRGGMQYGYNPLTGKIELHHVPPSLQRQWICDETGPSLYEQWWSK